MTAAIYYYPASTDTLETIDLLSDLSDVRPTPIWDQEVSRSFTGREYTLIFGFRHRIEVILSRFSSEALARDLYSLETHLLGGGLCGVTESQPKAWAGFARSPNQLERGVTKIRTRGNVFYNRSAALAADDPVVVQAGPPLYEVEHHTVSSVDATGRVITLSDGLRYDLSDAAWVLLRHRGFWPVMRIPADARTEPILTHDHRITYTLELVLEEHLFGLSAVEGERGAVAVGSAKGVGWQLDDIVRKYERQVGFGLRGPQIGRRR